MTPVAIGFAGLVAVVILLALRVPIAVGLGSVAIVGILAIRGPGPAFGALGEITYDFAANWELSAVPMFLLMGSIAFHSGITNSLYTAARVFLNRLPGGLAVATNLACAGFAALSGSSIATAAAMARLSVPEMLRAGYQKELATGTVAAAGTLGVLIPPSIPFVIYGWYTEQPIGKLLIAGVIPGLMTAAFYTALIIGRCVANPKLAPRIEVEASREEKWRVLREVWPLPVLIVVMTGGIYGGITTPTEAGAFGAFCTLIVAAIRRKLSWKIFVTSVFQAAQTTATIFFIAIGAILLTRFLAIAGVPQYLVGAIGDLALNPLTLVLCMTAIYLVLGCFLDSIGLMLLTLPIFLPMFRALHLDLIWLGVLVVKFLEIGVLTPPVGLNVYVVKEASGNSVDLATVFRGVGWFLACEVVIITLLIAFPQISLYLPSLMGP
jgi:tripartite ATP-independent transporter DctM subunit